MAPPPPPPPPLCFPLFRGKSRRRLTFSEKSAVESFDSQRSSIQRLDRANSYSPTATVTSHADAAEKLTFSTDTQSYDSARNHRTDAIEVKPVLRRKSTKGRSYSMSTPVTPPKKSLWGYGVGLGKKEKDRERELQDTIYEGEDSLDLTRNVSQESRPPGYESPGAYSDSQRSRGSSNIEYVNPLPPRSAPSHSRSNTYNSNQSKSTDRSARSGSRSGSGNVPRRPPLNASESSDTLVGSAYERKINDLDVIPERVDTNDRLNALRELMKKDNLDYYIVPSLDAHGSEYVAIHDKRREWISGFTGSAGEGIISKSNAYLITDSRYWTQSRSELDENWILIPAGVADGPRDWLEWLVDRANESRVGIDSRMITHQNAVKLNQALQKKKSKLVYPPQNLVDIIWAERPSRSREPVFVQPLSFTGKEAGAKLAELRAWITEQAPSVPSYSKAEPKPSQMQVGTLISSLPNIAWLLNLRGDDIPFNPVFHSYLFVGLQQATLFIEPAKISDEVNQYLKSIGVDTKEYNDVWSFLRRKPWGDGNLIIAPETSQAIALVLTSFRYTVIPSYIDEVKAIKNEVELQGLRLAYIRDGVAFVKFLAWLEQKLLQGYEITEYEAAWRLTEYRRMGMNYMGLAYENISASGPNAALPHYSPRKSTAKVIDRKTPYLNDSGGQYRDGTCDTARTVHFDRPSDAQCEAFTRVLQGHIAIDSAIFPEGTTGAQLDVLARKALWQDGLNYLHGTGHGFGSYLNVHEGPHGFSSNVPLVPGHVITNEPGFYKDGEWGIRLESALIVKRVKTKNSFGGDAWLGFERLTCVPIQTKMVKDVMLSKEERQWLRAHNKECLDVLEPFLGKDKRALKWLRREAERGIGLAKAGPGGLAIDWA
ncbi:uncharacterized protein FIBRA_05320 [Fibroporia radiculosa]|uniref:Aminopeptidase P N-terminal domain-containing protein n=1 Tax=Fibroporia radiculosa TaxID=599839 RepID=J4IAN0_9APHY|nr:uncharacterized protein FIBRA_05320 [Fibroporia radiculosa]CCM03196.1 predicted protein [Fibroporia radiculosa]